MQIAGPIVLSRDRPRCSFINRAAGKPDGSGSGQMYINTPLADREKVIPSGVGFAPADKQGGLSLQYLVTIVLDAQCLA